MIYENTIPQHVEPSADELNIPEGVEIRSGNDLIKPEVTTGPYREEEASEDSLNEETVDEQAEESEGEEAEAENETPPELNEDKGINEIKKKIDEGQEGIDSLIDVAIKAEKLTQDDVNIFMTEYETNGSLSEKSLAKLEEAGYTRGFIMSYIQGQEALAQQYTQAIYEYAGGKQQFDKYVEHLQNTAPSMVNSLQRAMENSDIETIKGVFEMARHSMITQFGKPAMRSVTKKATVSVPKREEGFSSQEEMIKAINDPRYTRDAKYRAEVERKMLIK